MLEPRKPQPPITSTLPSGFLDCAGTGAIVYMVLALELEEWRLES